MLRTLRSRAPSLLAGVLVLWGASCSSPASVTPTPNDDAGGLTPSGPATDGGLDGDTQPVADDGGPAADSAGATMAEASVKEDGAAGDAPTDASCPAIDYKGPITITTGGTYSGNWKSTSVDTAAVNVATSAAVVIENANLEGPGNLIASTVGGTNITVRNTRGVSVNPNVLKRTKGSFLHLGDIAGLVVEHCDIVGANYGVTVNNFAGPVDGSAVVKIRYNQMTNMDGRYSDGHGGYESSQENGVGREYSHAVLLAHFLGVPNVEVAWNQFINAPGQSSVDDVINLYSASGSPSSPIVIHDNYLHGAYGSNPNIDNYTGGGIITDGSSGDTPTTASGFVKIYDNQVINNANYGVQIGAGHDVEAYGNRTVSTGLLPDGTWMASTFGNGVVVWNGYSQPSNVYFNDSAHDNVSGWVREQQSTQDAAARVAPPIRVDYYLPGCQGGWGTPGSRCTNNGGLPDPVSAGTESTEWTSWQSKLGSAGVVLGSQACIASKP